MQKMIRWDRWRDPINDEDGALHTLVSDESEPMPEDVERAFDNHIAKYPKPFYATPYGFVPANEFNQIGKHFDLWTGETNFRLTYRRCKAIENTAGVETFNVYSPYRFRIAIGRMFDSLDVKLAIITKLCKPKLELDPLSTSEVAGLKTLLKTKHKHWAIYVFPNQKKDFAFGDAEDVRQSYEFYKTVKQSIGGEVISSFNEPNEHRA